MNRDVVTKLIFELSKLPGIGEKTATRLAYHILKQDLDFAQSLSSAILDAKKNIFLCGRCYNLTDQDPCNICSSLDRANSTLCVVERPSDVLAIEQTMAHRGHYHVLHGALSPLDGIGPEDLKIRELLIRLKEDVDRPKISEIILATNPSVEGDATALYLSRLLKPMGLKITQLAHGLPVGGALEFADRQTIGKAMENRIAI